MKYDPLLVVATGDPEGIGPEVSLRALATLVREEPRLRALLVGDQDRLKSAAPFPFAEAGRVRAGGAGIGLVGRPNESGVRPGAGPSAAGGASALGILEVAEGLVREIAGAALVTAPVSKEAIQRAGVPFVGHTDWLAARVGVSEPIMLFAAGSLRVALATIHMPLAAVPEAIQSPRLQRLLLNLAAGLRRDFAIPNPKIAVLGLNPHAGEGGSLGREEITVIIPAIEAMRDVGLSVEGPFSADTFFRKEQLQRFDAILAMYHDQGLIPLKCLSFGESVNVTLGLPYVRTSVDHGTAFDLVRAGGRADESSMLHALRLARTLVRERAARGEDP